MSLPEIKIKVSVLAYEKRRPVTAVSQLKNDAGYVSEDALQKELAGMRMWVRGQFLGEVLPMPTSLCGITALQKMYGEPLTNRISGQSVLSRGLPVARAFKGCSPADFTGGE